MMPMAARFGSDGLPGWKAGCHHAELIRLAFLDRGLGDLGVHAAVQQLLVLGARLVDVTLQAGRLAFHFRRLGHAVLDGAELAAQFGGAGFEARDLRVGGPQLHGQLFGSRRAHPGGHGDLAGIDARLQRGDLPLDAFHIRMIGAVALAGFGERGLQRGELVLQRRAVAATRIRGAGQAQRLDLPSQRGRMSGWLASYCPGLAPQLFLGPREFVGIAERGGALGQALLE